MRILTYILYEYILYEYFNIRVRNIISQITYNYHSSLYPDTNYGSCKTSLNSLSDVSLEFNLHVNE